MLGFILVMMVLRGLAAIYFILVLVLAFGDYLVFRGSALYSGGWWFFYGG